MRRIYEAPDQSIPTQPLVYEFEDTAGRGAMQMAAIGGAMVRITPQGLDQIVHLLHQPKIVG